MWLLFVFLLLPRLIEMKFVTTNYCCLSCGNRHVMCQYPDKHNVGKQCLNYEAVSLDETRVLHLYNRIKSVKGVYAGAANAVKMEWDYELMEMAQRWANQCPNSTDQCRDTARGKVSQVVDYIVNEQFVSPSWEAVMLKWYIQDVPYKVINSYENGKWSALSQLIWGVTRRVGCAASSHLVHTGRLVTLVCNYSPPGNIPGQPVFNITGGMCTSCPEGSYCSDKVNLNLCVALRGVRHKPNLITLCIFLLLCSVIV